MIFFFEAICLNYWLWKPYLKCESLTSTDTFGCFIALTFSYQSSYNTTVSMILLLMHSPSYNIPAVACTSQKLPTSISYLDPSSVYDLTTAVAVSIFISLGWKFIILLVLAVAFIIEWYIYANMLDPIQNLHTLTHERSLEIGSTTILFAPFFNTIVVQFQSINSVVMLFTIGISFYSKIEQNLKDFLLSTLLSTINFYLSI